MPLLDETNLSNNAEFLARITAGIVRVSIDVIGNGAIPDGDRRRALARYALQ